MRLPHCLGYSGRVRVMVLPVKRLEDAKIRLGSVLAPLERAALTLAMLEDVLDAALVVPGWETWVLSPDEAVLEVAAGRGARAITEDEFSRLSREDQHPGEDRSDPCARAGTRSHREY